MSICASLLSVGSPAVERVIGILLLLKQFHVYNNCASIVVTLMELQALDLTRKCLPFFLNFFYLKDDLCDGFLRA